MTESYWSGFDGSLDGTAQVRYADRSHETVHAGQVFYWPTGHTVWTEEGFESIQLSPQVPMQHTLDHLRSKLGLTVASVS